VRMSGPKVDWAARCGPLRQAMADPELTGMERRVFVIMWTFTGPDGDGARPGVDLLTEMLGAHVRSVRNALQGLIGRGYLVVTEKPNRRGGKATTYSVRVPADEAISASPSRAKDESFSAPSETLYRAENDTFSAPQSRALMLKKEEESARSGAPPPTALTRGDGAPSQGSGSGSGDGLPLNHDDVRHLETWSEWAATSDISVDRPVCKEHPDGDPGKPCSGCAQARENGKKWDEERKDWHDERKELRSDISACRFCDERGQITTTDGLYWCDHQTPPPGWTPTGPVRCGECLDWGHSITPAKWDATRNSLVDCSPDDPDLYGRVVRRCECKTSNWIAPSVSADPPLNSFGIASSVSAEPTNTRSLNSEKPSGKENTR